MQVQLELSASSGFTAGGTVNTHLECNSINDCQKHGMDQHGLKTAALKYSSKRRCVLEERAMAQVLLIFGGDTAPGPRAKTERMERNSMDSNEADLGTGTRRHSRELGTAIAGNTLFAGGNPPNTGLQQKNGRYLNQTKLRLLQSS